MFLKFIEEMCKCSLVTIFLSFFKIIRRNRSIFFFTFWIFIRITIEWTEVGPYSVMFVTKSREMYLFTVEILKRHRDRKKIGLQIGLFAYNFTYHIERQLVEIYSNGRNINNKCLITLLLLWIKIERKQIFVTQSSCMNENKLWKCNGYIHKTIKN